MVFTYRKEVNPHDYDNSKKLNIGKEKFDMKKILCALMTFSIMIFLIPTKPVFSYDNGIVSADLRAVEVNLNDEVKSSESMQKMADLLGMDVRTFVTETSIPIFASRGFDTNNAMLNSLQTTSYFIPKEYNVQPYAEGSLSDTKSIVTSAADVNITIYYNSYTSSGFKYGKLTKTTGKVNNFKSGFRFSRVDSLLGSSGLTATQTTNKTSSSNNWTFNAPTNWVHNQMGNGFCNIGSGNTVYITRNGSTLYSGYLNVQVN